MKRLTISVCLLALLGGGWVASADEPAGFSTVAYAEVLARFVTDEGAVRYAALQADRTLLDELVGSLAGLDADGAEGWSERARVAFWINAYNALTIETIIDNYPISGSGLSALRYRASSIRQIPRVWSAPIHVVMGREVSLDQIEHEVLRKEFYEPRIHVALVERHLMGGDCLNVGCVPSKTLIRAGRAAFDARAGVAFGVALKGTVEVDFAAVMEGVRRVRADISPHDSARRFSEHYGVDVYLGEGRFCGQDTGEVNGTTLRFARAAIATGARAVAPPLGGLAATGFLTNETVFNLTELPRRLAVIGAGPIGCELAQAFARLGSRVTIIEIADQFLSREDPDGAEIVRSALGRDGVDVRLATRTTRVEATANGKVLHVESDSRSEAITVDDILVGAGSSTRRRRRSLP